MAFQQTDIQKLTMVLLSSFVISLLGSKTMKISCLSLSPTSLLTSYCTSLSPCSSPFHFLLLPILHFFYFFFLECKKEYHSYVIFDFWYLKSMSMLSVHPLVFFGLNFCSPLCFCSYWHLPEYCESPSFFPSLPFPRQKLHLAKTQLNLAVVSVLQCSVRWWVIMHEDEITR